MSANQLRILVVVDVVGVLATETLEGSVWLVDSNKTGGSSNEGTHRLRSTVRKGDQLIWTAMSLECEAFAAIDAIDIDSSYCEVTRGVYEGTDISYWLGKIKNDPGDSVIPYKLHFRLGSRPGAVSMSGPNLPSITGGRSN